MALILSLFWAVPGFGLIDLDAALPPGDPGFREHWILEAGWGLLVTTLVMVPLLAVSIAPSLARHVALHLHVVTACAVVAGLACLEPTMLALIAGFGLTAWAVWLPLRAEPRPWDDGGRVARLTWAMGITVVYAALPMLFGPESYTSKVAIILASLFVPALWLVIVSRDAVPGTATQARSWWLLVVSVVWAGPWLVYSASTVQASWDGLEYTGSHVERVSAHAAFALALGVLPLAAAGGWLPIRLSVATVCLGGGGFGAFAVLYPGHLLSPGDAWGVAAICGSVILLVASEVTVRRRGNREYHMAVPGLDPT